MGGNGRHRQRHLNRCSIGEESSHVASTGPLLKVTARVEDVERWCGQVADASDWHDVSSFELWEINDAAGPSSRELACDTAY